MRKQAQSEVMSIDGHAAGSTGSKTYSWHKKPRHTAAAAAASSQRVCNYLSVGRIASRLLLRLVMECLQLDRFSTRMPYTRTIVVRLSVFCTVFFVRTHTFIDLSGNSSLQQICKSAR